MIGRIAGRIEMRGLDHVLIDVRGVGYVVYCSDRTLQALPAVGEAAALWTELVVREDLLQLFGFLTLVEKEWNRLLTSVQGVGAKTAQRIVLELKDKAHGVMAMAEAVPSPAGVVDDVVIPVTRAAPAVRDNAQADALSALANLGYGPGDAAGAVARAAQEQPDADTPALIRAALKLLAPS